MFIKGNCVIYIDKNLKVYVNSTGIFVLWLKITIKGIKHSMQNSISQTFRVFKIKVSL